MRRAPLEDPYLAVVRRFNRFGVRYVVVGMAGINYYARDPSGTFSSMDFDLFIEPTLQNVEAAVQALRPLGVAIGTADGLLAPGTLRRIVRDRRTLIVTTPEGLTVELLLSVSGYPFSAMARDANTFTLRGVPVKVGQLQKLLQSKRLAGRPKDRAFLRRYRQLLGEEL